MTPNCLPERPCQCSAPQQRGPTQSSYHSPPPLDSSTLKFLLIWQLKRKKCNLCVILMILPSITTRAEHFLMFLSHLFVLFICSSNSPTEALVFFLLICKNSLHINNINRFRICHFPKYVTLVFNFVYDSLMHKKFLNFELNVSFFSFIVSVFGIIFGISSHCKTI